MVEVIRRDKIKTDFCKKNGIHLLRISYKDFKNIESILEKKIDSIRARSYKKAA
jgi:hypothetical protein